MMLCPDNVTNQWDQKKQAGIGGTAPAPAQPLLLATQGTATKKTKAILFI